MAITEEDRKKTYKDNVGKLMHLSIYEGLG